MLGILGKELQSAHFSSSYPTHTLTDASCISTKFKNVFLFRVCAVQKVWVLFKSKQKKGQASAQLCCSQEESPQLQAGSWG